MTSSRFGQNSFSQSSRDMSDIAWRHVIEGQDQNGRKTLICLHCGKGDVSACLKVPFDIQYLMRETLKRIETKNKEKANSSKYANPYGASVHEFEGDKINEDNEEPLVDAIATTGLKYKHPNYHGLRVNLLRDATKEVQLLVDSYKKTWENVGCTLTADGWTNNSHRSLINFIMYCPKGVSFVKSFDASDVVKDAGRLLKIFEEIALWIGLSSIVHFVSVNGSNYKDAERMLSEKYPSITWSPCAAYSINLVLKDIAETDHVYLAKRAFEGWKEIVRLSTTRFATTFIAMISLHKHKHNLQAMVTDKSFVDS
ncbi:uncharacterized protein LOC116115580 [Pistacia vera]|uniref:uncharacterized protein LOC116115580 n=1 Tax=Pistacia vera TaxID=55513 RepID=UPI0012638345|nr:uncharacterized protein LOC116115580 [Pistacia vera]